MKKLFPIFIISIILITACCKDKNPSLAGCQTVEDEYYIKNLNGAEKYLWAKPGSYWIYENTKTGDLDTQTVVNFSFFTDTARGFRGHKKTRRQVFIVFDLLYTNIFSSFNNWTYLNRTTGYDPNSNSDLNDVRLVNKTFVITEGEVHPFFFPLEVGLVGGGTGSSFTTLKEVIPTYELRGKIYKNVAVFEVDGNPIWETKLNCERPKTKYYWAEGVGIIKKEFISCNYAWELIEYNIIN